MKKLLLAAGTACAMIAPPTASYAQVVGISITIAPPELPVYEQPPIPEQNDIWTPGYWAYGDEGYFWVPGTWVLAPQVGFLWTPAYWVMARAATHSTPVIGVRVSVFTVESTTVSVMADRVIRADVGTTASLRITAR
jgi:hypothetical protein